MDPETEVVMLLAKEIYGLVHERLMGLGFTDGDHLHTMGAMALEICSGQLRYSLPEGYITTAHMN